MSSSYCPSGKFWCSLFHRHGTQPRPAPTYTERPSEAPDAVKLWAEGHERFVRQAMRELNSPRVGQKVTHGNGEIHTITRIDEAGIHSESAAPPRTQEEE